MARRSDAKRTRTCGADDWAVRRWDRVHDGRPKLPTSFCQFWRTVLLWATLASTPLIGKMFQAHLYEAPPPSPLNPRIAMAGRAAEKGAKAIGTALWTLLWPLRVVFGSLWMAASSAAAWIDDREHVKRRIERTFAFLVVCFGAGAIIFWAVLLSIWFTQAWHADWRLFVIGCESLALTLGAIIWGRERIATGILAAGEAIAGVFGLLWEIAVVSHHRICPPMEIVRGPTP